MSENPQTPKETRRIALVKARWHAEIVDQAEAGLLDALDDHVVVDVFDVPGALEIPLAAKRIASAGEHDVVIGAAFVVDGGIYRHDFVAGSVVDALIRVGLETDTPILSVVLTPHNFQETEPHEQFFSAHFRIKGAEAAHAAQMVMEKPAMRSVAA